MLADVFAIVALFYPFENPAFLHIGQLRLAYTADQASDHITPECDGYFP